MANNCLLLWVIALAVTAVLPAAHAARILGFFPSPSKSHLLIHCAEADALSAAGHDVTVIATLPNLYKHATYKYIHIDGPKLDPNFANKIINDPQPMYKVFSGLLNTMLGLANDTLVHPTMQTFLQQHGAGSFDLLMLGYFMNDFHLGLAAHFQCPVVLSFMLQPAFGLNTIIANPAEVAYVPLLFGGAKQPMTFMQRVINFCGHLFEVFVMDTYLEHLNQNYYNSHFPADRYPSLTDMKRNISLIFANHHYVSQGPIRPNVPALIEIGGIQIKEKPSPLPADIAAAADNAKDGFIYFSLGTVVQGKFLPKDKVQVLFGVLSKLPYLVIWKWSDGELPGTSNNIIYKSWLPQDDVLSHPNCKVFITHGGQGGVVEAQYHGVPMVGIPLFGDQTTNIKNVVSSGFGLSVDYMTLSAPKFEHAIKEVLQNTSYSQAIKKFSRIYRDRPLTPRQMVIFWVEYVLRHHGAKHLQSPAVFLNRWQLLSLDVLAFIAVVFSAVLGTLVFSCKLCCCRGRKSSQIKKTTKNKKYQ